MSLKIFHQSTRLKSIGLFLLITSLFPMNSYAEEEEILIQQDEDASYYEHRVNGVLTEIKVVPKVGPAYFLVPDDGGAWIRVEESQILVPKWKIFEW